MARWTHDATHNPAGGLKRAHASGGTFQLARANRSSTIDAAAYFLSKPLRTGALSRDHKQTKPYTHRVIHRNCGSITVGDWRVHFVAALKKELAQWAHAVKLAGVSAQ
jgi:hypothetical protein